MAHSTAAAIADQDNGCIEDEPPTLRVFAFHLPQEAVRPELRASVQAGAPRSFETAPADFLSDGERIAAASVWAVAVCLFGAFIALGAVR